MGNITIPGPLRTGRKNNPHSSTIGHVAVQQKVGVSGIAGAGTHTHTFADRLPACDITGIRLNVQSTFAATAAAIVHFKIGTTAQASAYGTFAVLGAGVYDFGTIGASAGGSHVEAIASSMSNWTNVAEGTNLIVTVSAPVTAFASSRGVIYVSYYQNSAATV